MARSAQQYTEALNRMGENLIETTRQIAEINVKAGEKLLEQQAEFVGQLVNWSTRHVDFASKAIGYSELFSTQAQIAQEYTQQWVNNWRRSAELVSEASRAIGSAVDQATRTTLDQAAQASRATRESASRQAASS